MSKVSFTHINKRFADGTQAITDLSLTVNDGEFLVLLGPSGCGKSTLLRMAAGLEQPDSGEILIDDSVVNDLDPQQRNVAMVFQNYALYPHMTVRQNLAFPLRMQGMPQTDMKQRIHSVAGRLNLMELLDKLPKDLSGGQRQRVAMGRALVREPRVFLLDEPLSNLDAELRQLIRQDIARLQRDTGITTLYVTHDQVEAMTLGQRIAVLRSGVLQQLGSAHVLYTQPANTFVAGFIGSPGMNIFKIALQRGTRGHEVLINDELFSLHGSGYTDQQLAPLQGQAVLAGVRPEALHLTDTGKTDTFGLAVTLTAVERLGHEVIVHFPAINQNAGTAMEHCARLPYQDNLRAGDSITLGLTADDLYLFDPDGSAIERAEPAITKLP